MVEVDESVLRHWHLTKTTTNQMKTTGMELMHKPSVRSTARSLTNSEMHYHERSPGGGKVSKVKKGTPKKTVATIRKMFENSTRPTSGGLVGLRQQTQINFNLPQREFVTRQKTKICADQPGGGLGTGPREPCGRKVRPNSDWISQPEVGRASQPDGGTQGQPGHG